MSAPHIPPLLFHGTSHAFDRFDPRHLGRSVRNPTTEFGFFFSEDAEDAEYWAHRAARFDLYVRGKAMETFRAKVEAGGQIFVQGEALAKGKAISVSTLEPKTYEAKITKIHKTGTNEYGDWTAAKVAIDGMQNERNVMLSGADARAASAAGVGGKITFQGAWKPEKNEENGNWYSRLVSASSLEPRGAQEATPTP